MSLVIGNVPEIGQRLTQGPSNYFIRVNFGYKKGMPKKHKIGKDNVTSASQRLVLSSTST